MKDGFEVGVPEECVGLRDVRRGIDQIDRQIVELLALRRRFVEKAVEFKDSEAAVRAPERVREMFVERRRWAQETNVSAELVDRVFRTVVDHFVEQEVHHWTGDQP